MRRGSSSRSLFVLCLLPSLGASCAPGESTSGSGGKIGVSGGRSGADGGASVGGGRLSGGRSGADGGASSDGGAPIGGGGRSGADGGAPSDGGAPTGGGGRSGADGGASSDGGAPIGGGGRLTTGGRGSADGGAPPGGAPGNGGTTIGGAGSDGGQGGESPSGGINGTGGEDGGGGGTTDPDDFEIVPCALTSNVAPGSIANVGVLTFAADLPSATRAVVQFGKSTNYSLEAPVEWGAPNHRTLLLGAAPEQTYHYRVIVIAGPKACVSSDRAWTTGSAAPGSLPNRYVTPGSSEAERADGFRIVAGGPSSTRVHIVDGDGEVVWAYSFPQGVVSAQMSWDGRFMLARNVGSFAGSGGGTVWRVPMEGGPVEVEASGGAVDFAAVPGGVAIADGPTGQCDQLRLPGNVVVDLAPFLTPFPANGAANDCRVQAINYHVAGFYTLSDPSRNVIIKISEDGEFLGSIGVPPTQEMEGSVVAEGVGSTWQVQSGHHLYDSTHALIFSNGSFSGGQSKVLHYTISGSTATLDWSYADAGTSPVLGNVLKLPNGNVLVQSSQSNRLDELDASGVLIQSMTGAGAGYARYRKTLYGPPMNYDIEL
jgi:hypothetical protein